MYRSSVRFTITPLVSGDSSSGASVYNFNYTAELAAQMAETFPYIMKSNILTDIMKNEAKTDAIALSVRKALKSHGYETALSVGKSEYRIDIGVVDKNNPTQLAENGIVAYVVCATMILSGAFFIFISTLINKHKT